LLNSLPQRPIQIEGRLNSISHNKGGILEPQSIRQQSTNATAQSSKEGSAESQIRQLMEDVSEAVRTRDMETILSAYADDLVLYDVRDALKTNKEGLRKSWQECFDSSREFSYKIKDLKLQVSEDAAFSFCLSHCTGVTTDQKPIDIWVRVTSCYAHRQGEWQVVHEHVSDPGDFMTGKILQDLKPDQPHRM
jgi:ketosteroid isomerase-like protein